MHTSYFKSHLRDLLGFNRKVAHVGNAARPVNTDGYSRINPIAAIASFSQSLVI